MENEKFFAVLKCQRCGDKFRHGKPMDLAQAELQFNRYADTGELYFDENRIFAHNCCDGARGVAEYIGYEPEQPLDEYISPEGRFERGNWRDRTDWRPGAVPKPTAVICCVCDNIIEETGTDLDGSPCHIGCWHEVMRLRGNQVIGSRSEIEEIKAAFRDPDYFKPLAEHKKDRQPFIGKESLPRAEWEKQSVQRDPFTVMSGIQAFFLPPRVRFFCTSDEWAKFNNALRVLPLDKGGDLGLGLMSEAFVDVFGEEAYKTAREYMIRGVLLDVQITTKVVSRLDDTLKERQG